MSSPLLLAIALMLPLSALATPVAPRQETTPPRLEAPQQGGDGAAAERLAPQTEADVLATLDAWYESQLVIASLAATESRDSAIRNYAQGLASSYGRYRDELTYLRSQSEYPLVDQPQAEQVRSEGRAAVSRLQQVPDIDFDVAFVEAQAAQTRQFLRILAYDLIPLTADPDLQTLLLQTKGTAKTDLAVLRGFQTRYGTLPTGI